MILPPFVFNILLSIASAATTSTHNSVPPLLSSSIDFFSTSRNIITSCVVIGSFGGAIRWTLYSYNSDIKRALLRNDLEQLKYAISWGADINESINIYDHVSHRESIRPIYYVIKNNLFDILRFFLRENIKADIKDFWDKTPLDYALEKNQKAIVVCLFLHNVTDYDLHSKALTDEMKALFSVFRFYRFAKKVKEAALFSLLTSKALQNIVYIEKKYDAIGFALLNDDHKGIEYCKKKELFTNEDVLMAIAENKGRIAFLSRYLQDIALEKIDFNSIILQAKKNENEVCMNRVKGYARTLYGLKGSKLYKKIGGSAITQKILSYVNCYSE